MLIAKPLLIVIKLRNLGSKSDISTVEHSHSGSFSTTRQFEYSTIRTKYVNNCVCVTCVMSLLIIERSIQSINLNYMQPVSTHNNDHQYTYHHHHKLNKQSRRPLEMPVHSNIIIHRRFVFPIALTVLSIFSLCYLSVPSVFSLSSTPHNDCPFPIDPL